MATKLALHCHRAGPDVDAAIRACQWAACKALDTVLPLQTAQAAGIPVRILRVFGVEALAPAAAAARFLSHDLSAVTHLQLVCEQAPGYDPAWQGAVIAALRAGGYRGRFLVGGFADGTPASFAGNPPHFPDLEPLYPLLRRPDADLALDCYTGILASDPRWAQWAPWTAQRATLLHDDLARQGIAVNVVVTESGGDNAPPVPSGGGWQARGWSQADYAATLAAIDRDDRAHDWLLARCIFTLGAAPDWAAYEIAPIVPALAAYVRSQGGSPVPDYAGAAWAPSPNYWPGRSGHAVTAVVLHGTAGPGAVSWFANPASAVSAHYVVGEDGSVTQCVAEADSAWHAGVVTPDSAFAGLPNPNYWTIGVEHERDKANANPMPAAQIAASLALVADLLRRYGPLQLILHDQIDVGRVCPGPGFPFDQFEALLAPSPPNGGTDVAVTDEAAARFAALGVQPNRAGAIFAAYAQRTAAWLAAGKANVLDPTPAIRPEWSNGQLARCPFDNGTILEWHASDGQVYQVEQKDRAAVFAACGWGRPA